MTGAENGIMIYLDTHVVIWLYAGLKDAFSPKAVELIESEDLYISPMVMLEVQYLKEIGRISAEPALICENLAGSIGLQICGRPFLQVVTEAMTITWTRDPFDRIIAASANWADARLLTKDETILKNFPNAVWD